jgi:hypothetical protein
MISNNFAIRIFVVLSLLSLLALAGGCGGGGGGGGGPAPTLSSITLTPANPSIVTGGSQQFTATGTFSDGSTQDLTSQVTWSATGLVQVSATGLATSTGATGTATITATLGAISGSTTLTVTATVTPGANVMAITVDGSLCSPATSANYFNKPCVSVTVCNPGTSTCQTVTDILLDTGSYGLRIFKQAIPNLTLPEVASGAGSLASCIHFADQSSVWGPIKLASVQLGNEPAVQMRIQVIDASFAPGLIPSSCAGADPDPASAGYAGILGVGVFAEDCGSRCASSAANGIYFSCTGSSCSGTTVSTANQVPNPVARLAQDNNGMLVKLPGVPLGGVSSLDGSIIFGIGTQANNTPGSPTVLPTDQAGEFTTAFSGDNDSSFLDTGSNGLFFRNASSLPLCAAPNAAWYCPPTTTSLAATAVGAGGSPSVAIQFNIGNFGNLLTGPNLVFSEIGGPSDFGFDWGLPFFLGRNVFVGINGRSSSLGTGPYVGF